MVCVVCSCCTTSPYREVWIGSGEILCHDIYPARPITTVSLTTNTYGMMDGHSSCAPRTVSPRVQFSGACEQSHWWPARHTAGGRLLSVVQAATCPRISLKAYTAITWHNNLANLGSNPYSPIIAARQRVPRRYQQRHRGRLFTHIMPVLVLLSVVG